MYFLPIDLNNVYTYLHSFLIVQFIYVRVFVCLSAYVVQSACNNQDDAVTDLFRQPVLSFNYVENILTGRLLFNL